MNSKCIGCGVTLQSHEPKKLGFTQNLDRKYCERCFRIKNYNEYQKVDIPVNVFYNIIDEINNTNDLVLLVVDIMSAGSELKKIVSRLQCKPLIVVSKRDIFSYKVNDKKILDLIDVPCIDKILVSSNKNYNIDLLMNLINTYKSSSKIYLIGLTNSGKSTLINKIIYNYTDLNSNITTSMLPSTTLDKIEIKISDELTLIDTPGIIDRGNISNYLDEKILKKLIIKCEIKPITYQIKNKQYLFIEDFIKIECLTSCDMTFYMSNKLKIDRMFKDKQVNLSIRRLDLNTSCDVFINGLGYIYINKPAQINIFTYDDVEIYIRDK